MFEFTKRSRKVLEVLAQVEARRLNSDILTPEHIMIALLNDEDSVAARILKNIGINFDKFKQEIEQGVRSEGTSLVLGTIPVGPGYKKIIEISKDEARKLKNSYIGTEHLLLALFREGSFSGIESLSRDGVDYNVVRNEILRVLGVRVGAEKITTQKAKSESHPISIEEFTRDLTAAAADDRLDPVIGRETEINRVIRILSRKRKNNPVLIGEAGVGKTAIVEGLAQRIIKKQVPESLQNCRVLSLDMASIIAGTKYRGEFEDRLKKIVKDIQENRNVIVFIDEIHTIIGAGAAEGAIDAANILKPVLARGELQCIGATTLNEYRMYLEKDAALVRRFQSVFVEEPGQDESFRILMGLKDRYELHHKVHYSNETILRAVALAARYIQDRYLPDKAIDLIDEAGAQARLNNLEIPVDILNLENEINEMTTRKNELVLMQEYEKAAAMRDIIIEKKSQLETKQASWLEKSDEYRIEVSPENIAAIVSESTGIPVESLEESETNKLIRMESEIQHRIVGQEEAVSTVSRAIRRSRLGLGGIHRPRTSFMFLGPTGVGKTELARTLAEFLFGNEKHMIRLDMSEYMEKHSVARLKGAPPGYVGYEEGGQLTEKVRRRPYSIILLDEIEKAHPEVFNILLQVLEEGELTTSSGITVSFRDTIIIMTSNIGSSIYQKQGRPGFLDAESRLTSDNDKVHEELKRTFSPEFLNRIDALVFFHRLEPDHIRSITDIMLKTLAASLSENGINIRFSAGVKSFLADEGYDDRYGARNLRRVIRTLVEEPLSMELLHHPENNRVVYVSVKSGQIHFKIRSSDNIISQSEDEDAVILSSQTEPVRK